MSDVKPPVAATATKPAADASPAKPAESAAHAVADVAVVAAGNVNSQARSNRLKKTGGTVREVFQGLSSPDVPTRNAAILFVLSLAGIVFVLILAGSYFWQSRKLMHDELANTGDAGKNFGEFIRKQSEEAKRKYTFQSLGTFNIELKPVDSEVKAKGVMNMAEVEIQAQCDKKETCEFLEDQSAKVKDEVTQVFTAMERDELLSKEGKKRMKKKIIDRLNLFLTEGKVENLFFSKLIIN
jgi:flagellar basal body-associated protein FliL